MRYAILDAQNVVRNVIELDPANVSQFPGAVALADPGDIGSTYDPVAKTFSAPVHDTPREISVVEFMERFSLASREAMRASVDPVVVDFLDLLKHAQTVLLDSSDVQQGVAYMQSAGLCTASEAAKAVA